MAEAQRTFVRTLTVRSREEGAVEVERRLHAVAAAQRNVLTATNQSAVAMDQSARRLASSVTALAAVETRLVGNAAATRRFVGDARTMQQALDAGAISADRYAERVGQLRQELQAAGSVRIGNVDQSGLNALLGMRTPSAGSARDSASVFEAEAASVARLRAELDPLTAARERLNAEITEYEGYAARGAISTLELSQATSLANDRFTAAAARAGDLGQKVKLTSGQVQNLGYQLNDVATMAAMGASPFAILASQGGQVAQLLGDGPGGVRGSLSAIGAGIGGFVSSLGPAGPALAGLALAAGAFALIVRSDIEPLADVIDRQADAVGRLRAAYGIAATSAEDYARRSRQSTMSVTQRQYDADLSRLQGEVGNIGAELFGGRANSGRETLQSFAPLREAYAELRASAVAGVPDIQAFRNSLAEIVATAPEQGWWADGVKDVADEMMRSLQQTEDFQIGLLGVRDVLDEARTGAGAAADEVGRLRKEMEGLAYSTTAAANIDQLYARRLGQIANTRSSPRAIEGMAEAADRDRTAALDELARPARESLATARDALANTGLSDVDRRLAETAQDYDRRIAEHRRTLNDYAGGIALLEEKEVALETVRREAAIEEAKRADDYSRASVDRIAGINEQVSALEMEVSLLGQSEGATAGARMAMTALAAAKRAAAEAGMPLNPDEIATISAAASQIGLLTDRLDAMREAQENARRVADIGRDLDFDIRTAGLPQLEQDIARTLDGLKLAPDSFEGRQIAAGERYLDSLDRYQERMEEMRELNRDVWGGMADDIMSGKSALEALEGGLNKIASDLISRTMDQASDALFDMMAPMLGQAPKKPEGLDLAGLAARGATPTAPMYVSVVGGAGLASLMGGAVSGGQAGAQAGGAVGAITSALRPANDNVGGAVDAMQGFLGFSERGTSGLALNSFMSANGVDIDAARTAWCAAFVNSALRSVGVDGNGSLVANSFLDFGSAVSPSAVMKGDVLVQSRGLGLDQTGGHVGLATGASRMGSRGLELQMISGNSNNAVQRTWETASELSVRRATESLATSAGELAPSAAAFAGNLDQQLNGALLGGVGQIADQFLPGFGGVLQQLLAGMQNAGAGGGGGIGGLLGGLFGGPKISAGAQAAIAANPGGGLWSSGGYTGPGGVHDPAGIVHRGEVVWSQKDVARAGGPAVVDAMRLGLPGYAAGGVVGGGGRPARGSSPTVTIVDMRGAGAPAIEQRETRDADGRPQLEMIVRDVVADETTRPNARTNRRLRQDFDLKRQAMVR